MVRARNLAIILRVAPYVTASNVKLTHYLGTLPASSQVSQSASISFLFRRGQPFPSSPSFTWALNCERAEIRLVAPSGISLQADAYDEPVTIQVHDFETDTLADIEWTWNDEQIQVPRRARSVQKVLYAFADAKQNGDLHGEAGWVSLEAAATRAYQIERWLDGFKE